MKINLQSVELMMRQIVIACEESPSLWCFELHYLPFKRIQLFLLND